MRAALLALVLLAAWQAYAKLGGVDDFLLPAPTEIATSLVDDRALLWTNFRVTAGEVLLGIGVALIAGVACALAIHVSQTLRRTVYPLLIASQTIPIVIVAPLLVAWLGYDLAPKLVIIALVCFFPVTVTALDGLRAVDPEVRKLMWTFDASRLQTLRRVELPWAMPAIFSGARIAVTVAVIGAVLAEQAGSSEGLGHLVLQAIPQFETARAYAAVVILAAFAVALFALLTLVERAGAAVGPPLATRRSPFVRKHLLIVLGLVAAVVVAGCGSKQDDTAAPPVRKLDVVLDFFPNADHVGIYAAIADGEFKRVGLDVQPRVPSDPAAPLKLLAAGKADLAISYEPELLLARDKGLRLVSVGAIVQKPLTSIIALPASGVTTPAQLAGKKVGTAGIPYQSAYLKTILDKAGRDPGTVDEINVGFNLVPALLSGRVDATLGGFWNYEGVQLQLAKRRPTIIPVDRAGVPTYNELIVVARQDDLLTKGGADVRRFMRALSQGYAQAKADPVKATGQLVAANPSLDRRLQLASVRATLPVFFPANANRPFGWQDPAQWARYGAWMLRNDLVTRPPDAGAALTNEFLPGQGI